MAGLNLTPIKGGSGRKQLAEISDSLKETVEEAIVYFADHTGRLETEAFTSKDVADNWLSEARAYCYQRPAGRMVLSGNPARAKGNTLKDGAGPYVVRFSIEPYVASVSDDSAE